MTVLSFVRSTPKRRRRTPKCAGLSGLGYNYDDVRCVVFGLWLGARKEHIRRDL
jgi:hypothetical protein